MGSPASCASSGSTRERQREPSGPLYALRPRAVRRPQVRGGGQLVITPDGETHGPRPRFDSALVKALARAHRWQRLLESGKCGSITELAAAEKIDRSYLCRVLRLTLLAPEIVEAILDGRQTEEMTLPGLMKGLPVEWDGQSRSFADSSS